MNGIKFNLSGNMACFRKPETNSSIYQTFPYIHKVALLGLLGAVIGLKGYEQTKENEFPEFYRKLKDLKISIMPPKKNVVQHLITFTNTTGLASYEQGGTLIVKENVIANPEWTIFILEDNSEEYKKLKEYLLNKKTEFLPYLGRNDYEAIITDVKEVSFENINESEIIYDSLVIAEIEDCIVDSKNKRNKFLSYQTLPVGLNEIFQYNYESFLLSNEYLPLKEQSYKCNDFCIQFI